MTNSNPSDRPKRDTGLEAAILAVGSIPKLAQLLGIKHPSVYQWKRCPAERVSAVSRITGIPRHVLRPDLYELPVPPDDGKVAA